MVVENKTDGHIIKWVKLYEVSEPRVDDHSHLDI